MWRGRLQARIAGPRRDVSKTLLLVAAIVVAAIGSSMPGSARAAFDVAATRPDDPVSTGAVPPEETPDSVEEQPRVSPPPRTTTSARNDPYRTPPSRPVQAPPGMGDITAWLEYKTRSHLLALPQEARIFYRRALKMHDSGERAEALRLVRGAAKLDPQFVAPRLTLAAWLAFGHPGEALQQWNSAAGLMSESFMMQAVLASNGLYLAVQALALALIFAALVVIGLNEDRLRHAWVERLAPFVPATTARWWSWGILIAPYLMGLGPALPSVAFLGLLWPGSKLRERILFIALTVALVSVPLVTSVLDHVSAPLDGGRAPFYEVPQLQCEPYWPERRVQIERRVAAEPDNPFLQFGAAWLAQRAGDPATAEMHYRRALEGWPGDDRVLTNLGNTLAAMGRSDEALACYRQAVESNPRNAAAHFNASQIYTLNYDFPAASVELERASAIHFELVEIYQAERIEPRWAVLVDQWIAPRNFWSSLLRQPLGPAHAGALPPSWRSRIECSGRSFGLVTLLVAFGALVLGLVFQHEIPVRGCVNCGRAVCRRCAARRRALGLCASSSAVESRARSPEFGRVLLGQHRRKIQRRREKYGRLIAFAAPGVGYLTHRRLGPSFLLFAAGAVLWAATLGDPMPFSFEPRFSGPGHDVPWITIALGWLLFYGLSGLLFWLFDEQERARASAAPTRSRVSAPRRDQAVA